MFLRYRKRDLVDPVTTPYYKTYICHKYSALLVTYLSFETYIGRYCIYLLPFRYQ